MTSSARALALRAATLTVGLTLLVASPVAGKSGGVALGPTKPTTTTSAAQKTAAKKAAAAKAAAATKAAAAKKAAAKKAAALRVTGSLGGGANFPARTLVLTAPTRKALNASQVHVGENGRPVSGVTVTPLAQAAAGDLGLMLVIDQSPSMTGLPLAKAMAAARAVAAQRTGNQELGVITFDQTAFITLPLTSDPRLINAALAPTPPIGPGTRILPALTLALEQLSVAHIAAGAVILLSDGGDAERGTRLTPRSVAAQARAQGVPIFTVGVKDSHYSPSSLQNLASGGGKFVTGTGVQLPQIITSIAASLSGRYLVRYRSRIAPGQPITVSAKVAGSPGTVDLSYVAPAPPPVAAKPPARHAPAASNLNATQVLTALPSFAPATAPQVPSPQPPFWSSPLGVIVVAGICALLFGLALAILLMRLPGRRRAVQARVGNFIPGEEESGEDGLGPAAGGPLARRLERGRKWPQFVEDVEIGRIRRAPLALYKRAAVFAVLAAIILFLLVGSILLCIVPLLAWPFVLRAVVRRAARKQRMKFNDQLPSHLQDLAGAMRAGRSFVGAFSAVADSSNEPIQGEFERVVTDEQLGRSLEESVATIAVRMEADDMQQVALIAALHRRSGSNVAEALDRVAEGARENQELRRELRALTGQARLSSLVLTSLPILLLLGLTFIAPKYVHPMYHTPVGIILLVISAGMVFAGFRVMKRLVNIEV